MFSTIHKPMLSREDIDRLASIPSFDDTILHSLELGTFSSDPDTIRVILSTVRSIKDALGPILAQLNIEMDKATAIADLSGKLLSPVKRLPAECLGPIFEYCLLPQVPTSRDLPENRLPYRMLTRAMLVCKRWREVVISTSGLWGHILLPIGSSDINKDISIGGKMVDTFLSRSKLSPLYIASPSHGGSGSYVATYISMIVPHRARISSIVTDINRFMAALLFEGSSFSQLQQLTLRLEREYPDIDPITLDAPHLTHVSLSCFSRGRFPISLPWSQLSILLLRFASIADYSFILLEILPQLARLTMLKLMLTQVGLPPTTFEQSPEVPIELPLLHTLALNISLHTSGIYNRTSMLLQRLHVPKLTHLEIHHFTLSVITLGLKIMCQRSQCIVTELKAACGNGTLVSNPLLELHTVLPHLTSLHVWAHRYHGNMETVGATPLIKALASSSAFLPCLENLVMNDVADVEDTHEFMKMVRERMSDQNHVLLSLPNRKPLRTVSLYILRPLKETNDEVHDMLMAYRYDGTRVELRNCKLSSQRDEEKEQIAPDPRYWRKFDGSMSYL